VATGWGNGGDARSLDRLAAACILRPMITSVIGRRLVEVDVG
jgi:hypothetical protein